MQFYKILSFFIFDYIRTLLPYNELGIIKLPSTFVCEFALLKHTDFFFDF